ncbi:MAG: 23S rRNA pseudouridine(1911/1915/1917) synthase RluD [Gammaproteobacteria bacterium]|nr:23S rRNA pseudouridine(1911/1915/1917) synthase RluD [Gammaproteobacteria bacterium]
MTSNQDSADIFSFDVSDDMNGKRVDQVLAHYLSDYSRSRLQQWLKAGYVLMDGKPPKIKEKVHGGEKIEVRLAQAIDDSKPKENWAAQPISLDIVYEDEALIIVNKPVGLVVHPGAGNIDGTMVNALVHHAPELANIPRAGVIHRIDKDTSGILVIARTLAAHHSLTQLLQAREFTREYQAIVMGVMTGGGRVDAPIGRHPTQRTKMAVLQHSQTAKEAITHYRIGKRYRSHTLVNVKLETGRTHQIRVHMAHINYPIIGDAVYGGRLRIPANSSEQFLDGLRAFRRQALHARLLGFVHPVTNEYMEWEVDLPEDMTNLIELLEADLKEHEAR